MTRERACLACEGTGDDLTWYMDAAPACPACLGSGRQTDRITAQDAECDAATLRGLYRRKSDRSYHKTNVHRAESNAKYALLIDPARYGDAVARYATLSARAAFRAVPALREE